MPKKPFLPVKEIILTVFAIILIIFCFWKYDAVFFLLKTVFLALRPVFIGVAFAFVINSFAIRVVKIWRTDKVPEKVAWVISSLGVYVIFVGIIVAALYFVIPSLVGSVKQFFENFDVYYNNFSQTLAKLPLISITEKLLPPPEKIREYIPTAVSTATNALGGAARGVADTFIGFAVSFYFVLGKNSFKSGAKKVATALLSPTAYEKAEELYSVFVRTFSGFISGQLTEALIMGVLCFIGMLIFGFEYPLLISVIIAFTNLIPIFGPIMGTIPSAMILLFADPMSAIWFVIFIIVLQQIESQLIYPRVVGTSVGLKPFWTLFAIIVGGGLFGVWGMILGIPLLSVIYTEINRVISKKCENKGFDDVEKFR